MAAVETAVDVPDPGDAPPRGREETTAEIQIRKDKPLTPGGRPVSLAVQKASSCPSTEETCFLRRIIVPSNSFFVETMRSR